MELGKNNSPLAHSSLSFHDRCEELIQMCKHLKASIAICEFPRESYSKKKTKKKNKIKLKFKAFKYKKKPSANLHNALHQLSYALLIPLTFDKRHSSW